MKLTKRQKTWAQLDTDKVYTLAEAIEALRPYCSKKFDESLEIAIRLGVDVTKADQNIRGMLSLPNGTGKTVRVAVFTVNSADEAKKAGADVVGGEDLIEKVAAGEINFDRVIATPDMMPELGKIGKILGPKGLMPNPKTNTVTPDPAKAVEDINKGMIEFRTDSYGNIHGILGKVSFDEKALVENLNYAVTTIARMKPTSVKGKFINSISISATMGPGIKVDQNSFDI